MKMGASYKIKQTKEQDKVQQKERNTKNILWRWISAINNSATIRVKLIISYIVPIIFIILLGIVSFEKAAEGLKSSYEQSTQQAINMTSQYLQLGLESIEATSTEYLVDDTMKKYFSGYYTKEAVKNNLTLSTLHNSVLSKVQSDKFISAISVLSDKVESVTTTTNIKEKDICSNYYETETGKSLISSSKYIWAGSDLFLNEKLATEPESYSIRLIRSFNGTNALIVIDVDMNTVLDALKSMKLDRTGTLGFITPDRKEIIADNKEGKTGAIFTDEKFYAKAMASEDTSGITYAKYNGKENLIIYSKVGDTGAMICAAIPKSTILSKADSIKNTTVIIVIIACIIAVITGIYLSTGIDNTIKSIIQKLKKAASGDMTVDFSTKRKDEFRILMEEINHTFSNMKDLIKQVVILSDQVSEASYHVSNTSSNFLKSTGDISQAINEIEQGVMQQAKDAEQCLVQMDNLSNEIVTMTESTVEIGKIAEGTKCCVSEGMNVTKDLNQQTKATIEITTNIVKGIEDLADKSKSIGSIINVINDISNQTNLLSLNASIEAARAGEYGRGFAVVAGEIRNLAEQTHKQVNEIKNMVETIQNNTNEVVKTAKNAEEVMVLQDAAVKNTTDSFAQINVSVDNLMIHLKHIIENVDNIEDARVSTLGVIENISAVLEEIAASTNNVNQNSNDQLTSVDSLNQSAISLKDNSGKLVETTQKFQV